ncbi:hypothetical protein ACPWT1_19810 [Ramlibacter sp. MMS24-I3-19]|uniref:hypothetical protein n=1 Tax=Ramlibacter sp. MMS24-I3-19 TaxID=3416606 RepID=UPI003CFEF533
MGAIDPASLAQVHVPLPAVIALVAFIGWRIVVRVRRLLTRQRLRPWRARLSLVLFLWTGLGLIPRLWGDAVGLASEALGLAFGVGLALLALRHAQFERTADGIFYKPDVRIGLGLSVLLVGRVVWRVVELAHSPNPLAESPDAFIQSPATLVVLGTLIGYYGLYAAGLLRERRRLLRPSAA